MAKGFDRSAVRQDLDALEDPHVDRIRPVLLSILAGLLEARNPSDFHEVQEALLGTFAARQDCVTERRWSLDQHRKRLADLVRIEPKPLEDIRLRQRDIAIVEQQDRRDRVLQHAVRTIADGMAWRLLGCDRKVITLFGDAQRVGRLAPHDGFANERQEAAKLRREGASMVLHNDLTNCLRHGDLTVLFGWPPTEVTFPEVKSHGRSQAGTPQTARLNQKYRLASAGFDATGHGGAPLEVRRLRTPYRTHLDRLEPLFDQAGRTGYAGELIAPYLSVSAIDYPALQRTAAEPHDIAHRPAVAHGWKPEEPTIFGMSAAAIRLRERHVNLSYFAPLTIFPVPAEALLDLLLCRSDYISYLNVEALRPFFEARGIDVEFASGPDADERFLRARRRESHLTVPATIRNQMLRELMSADTLVDLVDEVLTDVEAGLTVAATGMHFCDETVAWPAARFAS